MARAQRVWNLTTSTAVSEWAMFGEGQRFVTAYISNPSTKAFENKIEVSAGASTSVITVLANATSTGANASRTSTGGAVFDKARVVSTGNATTGVVKVWLAASV